MININIAGFQIKIYDEDKHTFHWDIEFGNVLTDAGIAETVDAARKCAIVALTNFLDNVKKEIKYAGFNQYN